ncbi:MAG: choice-of-anchor L domain-containing protein [Marinovum sp.]|nr:choice-of-anchor L domain-containing protein [Marinovum sp.]
MPVAEKLPINTNANAMQMAEAMFGNGISIQSASYSGAQSASGIYSNGDEAAPDITPSDTGVILSTGNADAVTNASGDVNTTDDTSTNHSGNGDDDLSAISGQTTFDAAVFEATFVPDGSTLTMQVVFSSEEYLEYVNSGFNDAVGIWVNGQQADLTVGDGDITINNINDESNSNLYIDNASTDDTYNTEMDGFTVTLTLKAPVTPGEENTIKIGIADGGDGWYDSNLLIAGNSVQTSLVATDDSYDLQAGDELELDVLANDSSSDGGTLTITKINGQSVTVGDTITLATGEELELTENGISLVAPDGDGSGETTTNTFTYEVTDEDGNTDVAFVQLTATPCFVAGSLVEAENGFVPVELVRPGMRMKTRDHGIRTVRWVGSVDRIAANDDAPIVFEEGVLGAYQRTAVSPNHRLLLTGPSLPIYFDTDEILVPAKFLIDIPGVKRSVTHRAVRYVHILFDQHELIKCDGVWSESLYPGELGLNGFEAQREEIQRLFPELLTGGPEAFGPVARAVSTRYESRLVSAWAAVSRATTH